jgi:subtilisin family serine protease
VNAGERGVFRINPREANAMRIASPVNLAFPAADYRSGYRYVFTFDGTRVTLIDARPLHAIGLPLAAAVEFDSTIPTGERPALQTALREALVANNAPLRVPQNNSGFDNEVRYVFSVRLAMAGSAPFGGITLSAGDVTLALSRNGEILTEHKSTVTEFDEAGLYRALRRLITTETRWYRELGEIMGF